MTDFDVIVTSRLAPRWDALRQARNLERIEQRIERGRMSRRWVVAFFALAASAAVVGFFFGLWPAHKPSSATAARAPEASASARAPATETRFRDGSTATALTQGAVLELRAASDTEMAVVAKSGSFRFDVVPNPARQFVVEAGSVTVRVLGTRFVVGQEDHRVQVSVERGRVEVTWPEGRTELQATESGWFPPLPNGQETAAVLSAAGPAPSTVPSPHASSQHSRFVELTRNGDYQGAYAIIDQAPQLFGSSAEDLMMAADAARLSNHPRQAVGYLQRITKEHPSDSRAPLAAFTLGRIYMSQLGEPAAAARAFALVRQLAPAGALVEDAWAREAEALSQAGQHDAAQKLVEAYLKRYPSGRRSESLRQLGHL
jgi:transmembrane sensor